MLAPVSSALSRAVFKIGCRVRGRSIWDGLDSFCLFCGYRRSGHSAIGSVIDAHPDALISHELKALKG